MINVDGLANRAIIAILFASSWMPLAANGDTSPEPLGVTFDIANDVPQEEVDLIKEGLVIAQSFLDNVLGGDIEESIRNSIVVKIVATGEGNQEPGGFGSCCTALNQDGIRIFLDVANEGYPSSDLRKIGTSIHEYTHGWYSSLGCLTFFEQPLGNWMNEGLAEWVRRQAVVAEGLADSETELEQQEEFAFGSGALDVPLRYLQTTRTNGIWPGNVGDLAMEMLIGNSPNGIISARQICENVASGQSVAQSFEVAFGTHLELFYHAFEGSISLPPPAWVERSNIHPTSGDVDGDGVANNEDNCPTSPNFSQKDLDSDGDGNACDSDIDGDGVPNLEDAFPLYDGWSNDVDCDDIGDVVDGDDDNDGIPDHSDPTPQGQSATHPDLDQDGLGNDCDPDDDGDGLPDYYELEHNLDTLDPSDAGADLDGDALSNLDEFALGTDLNDPDSDGDGIMDGLDDAPGTQSNDCLGMGTDVVFKGVSIYSGESRTCAATSSVVIEPTVKVYGGGKLKIVAPQTTIKSGFELPTGGELNIVSGNPMPE